MEDRSSRRTLPVILLLAWLLVATGCELVAPWQPAAKRWLNDHVGRDGSHQGEKRATFFLSHGLGIAGACLCLVRREILGFSLLGVCYLMEAARHEVFYVREGGRPFDQSHLGPWIYLMLSLPIFWLAWREVQEREEARSALEEAE